MGLEHTEAPYLVAQGEAARLLGGIDRTTVWRMVKRGDLVRVRIGSRSFITRSSVLKFIDSRTEERPW